MTEQPKLTFNMLQQQLDSLMLRDRQRFTRRLHGVKKVKNPDAQQAIYQEMAKEIDQAAGKVVLREAARPVISYPENLPVSQKKQDILEEIIAEAKKRLENLPDAEYAKVIGGMLERLDESQGKEIIVSAKDKARLADVVKEKGYVLSDETRDIDSGFVVKNGDIEYNYSFDAIIMVQKEEMQITAAKILF